LHRTPLFRSLTGCAIGLVLLTPLMAAAQDVTESSLKAAFIYNFAKFTEWPTDAIAAGAPLVLCVLGDPAIGGALEQAVKGRTLSGHTIGVSQAASDGRSLKGCHLAYVSGMTAKQAAEVVAALGDTPVLTISDVEGFTRLGGIAQLFYAQGQLRFAVQPASATRARLQISSKLLSLAKTR
jgi:hypothetical protein